MKISNLDLLKRQHQEIGDILNKIEGYISAQTVVEKSFDISLNIGLLAGKLLTHLNSEDKYLYPSLANHPDQKTQTISKRFMEEMGGLSQAFTLYKGKYMIANNIKANPSQFTTETRTVFDAIRKRVAAEEKELYPLLK
ncbi:MAG: hemerythrin domain-containing protein [Bacillota bacterium]